MAVLHRFYCICFSLYRHFNGIFHTGISRLVLVSPFNAYLFYNSSCLNGWIGLDILYLRNEFNFWKVHGIMNTSGHLHLSKSSPKGFTLTLQVTRSIHVSMNLPKIEFIAYIYILL